MLIDNHGVGQQHCVVIGGKDNTVRRKLSFLAWFPSSYCISMLSVHIIF